MTASLKTVSRLAGAVLDELTAGLNVGDSRKVDRGLGFMPVHVECLQRTDHGVLFSIAHYYEQASSAQTRTLSCCEAQLGGSRSPFKTPSRAAWP